MVSIDQNLLRKLDEVNLDSKINPHQISLALTNRCPNLCPMCCMGAKEKGIDLDVDRFMKWFRECKVHNDIHDVSITGGESLVHEELIPLLEFLKGYNLKTGYKLKTGIATSGCARGKYHELYYNNLKTAVEKEFIDVLTITWAPLQGKDSWQRIEELLTFCDKMSKSYEGPDGGKRKIYPFEMKKVWKVSDFPGSVREFRAHIGSFLTRDDFFGAHGDYQEYNHRHTVRMLKTRKDISDVHWSGRTGKPPIKNRYCEFTKEYSKDRGLSIFLAFLSMRLPDTVIRHDGTVDICCSVYAGSPFKHLPKAGSIYEDDWVTIKGRFSKMHSLLPEYKNWLERHGLKHTCYTCVWDERNSFEEYLKSKLS